MSIAIAPLVVTGLALGLVAASLQDRGPRVVWNASASVPIGLYSLRTVETLTVGDLVVARLPGDLAAWMIERDYIGRDTLLVKRVAAVPGMSVCRHDRRIEIGGASVASAASSDRAGRPLPVWSGCRVLVEEEVFLLNADVEDSLDGRYFGPLPASQVIGQAVPLWTLRGG